MSSPEDNQAPRLSRAASTVRKSVFAALSGRIEARRAAGEPLIPLQIGDTYLPPVAEAVVAPSAEDLGIYGAIPGLPELRAELARHRREQGLVTAVGPDNVHVGCGCTHALFCAVRAVLDPGDEVLVSSPYWPLFPGLAASAGASIVEVPLAARLHDPDFDPRALLEAAVTPRTRALYLITPNNPGGQVLDPRTLEVCAAFARERDLWVFADEVYADFVYEGEHRSIAALPGMAARTITTFSMSKSHGLAGARIGYVIADEPVIAAVRKISNHTLYNVPVTMQRVALAAQQHGAAWIDAARHHYRAARDATSEALTAIGIEHRPPAGGSFFFLDLGPRLGSGDLTALLERAIDHGVLLAPGEAFGEGFERHVRLCFTGVPVEQVLSGVERLGRALEEA